MKPLLLADCYLDDPGGAGNFLPRLRGVPAEVIRPAHAPYRANPEDFSGMVITGSAASVVIDPPAWVSPLLSLIQEIHAAGLPILGVCFGHQALAHLFCGPHRVHLSPTPEIGWYDIERTGADPLLEGFDPSFRTFVSHMDEVIAGHSDMEILAGTERCEVHAFRIKEEPLWGVQFHSEMGTEETARLVHSRAKKSPELGVEPDAVLAGAVDSTPLIEQLLANFLKQL